MQRCGQTMNEQPSSPIPFTRSVCPAPTSGDDSGAVRRWLVLFVGVPRVGTVWFSSVTDAEDKDETEEMPGSALQMPRRGEGTWAGRAHLADCDLMPHVMSLLSPLPAMPCSSLPWLMFINSHLLHLDDLRTWQHRRRHRLIADERKAGTTGWNHHSADACPSWHSTAHTTGGGHSCSCCSGCCCHGNTPGNLGRSKWASRCHLLGAAVASTQTLGQCIQYPACQTSAGCRCKGAGAEERVGLLGTLVSACVLGAAPRLLRQPHPACSTKHNALTRVGPS